MSDGQTICRHDVGTQPFVGSGMGGGTRGVSAENDTVAPEAGTLSKQIVTCADSPSKQVFHITEREGKVVATIALPLGGVVAEEPGEPVAPVMVAGALTVAVTE